jgi:hypothetical protein
MEESCSWYAATHQAEVGQLQHAALQVWMVVGEESRFSYLLLCDSFGD